MSNYKQTDYKAGVFMKHLVVCCDGTWQELESLYPTNVMKIAQAILPVDNDGNSQVVYYDEGVGTENRNSITGGAFGYGLEKNIVQAYLFLSLNYSPGDKIYLFGFSRGAYTVRSLAGLIYCSGLLTRSKVRLIPRAYELYRDKDIKPSSIEAVNFRQAYGQRVPIEVLGCWDTVGSLGVPDQVPYLPIDNWINDKYQYHDTVINKMVQNAFHAKAIDEHRKVFDISPMTSYKECNHNVVEKWFPGDHSCIGGGDENKAKLSNRPLVWMAQQVEACRCGLQLDLELAEGGIDYDCTIDFENSGDGLFKLFGSHHRTIEDSFDELDETVIRRWRALEYYRPKNLAKRFAQLLDGDPI